MSFCRAKFQETAAQHIRRQLQLLKAELPLPPENDDTLASMAAAGFGSHVLEDDQCEDEETEQPSTSLTQTACCHFCIVRAAACAILTRLMRHS